MSLAKYNVGDLIVDPTTLNVLMILESPHINEYVHQHPAAGESALELTQFLIRQGYLRDFNPNLPIGCNIKDINYQALGILNCSHLPMNPTFYPCSLSDDDQSQIDHLVAIKQILAQISANLSNQSPLELSDNIIFKDFAQRLTHVLMQAHPDLIIVPCGATASGFMTAFAANYPHPLNLLKGLPHPTESDWQDKIPMLDLTDRIPQSLLP